MSISSAISLRIKLHELFTELSEFAIHVTVFKVNLIKWMLPNGICSQWIPKLPWTILWIYHLCVSLGCNFCAQVLCNWFGKASKNNWIPTLLKLTQRILPLVNGLLKQQGCITGFLLEIRRKSHFASIDLNTSIRGQDYLALIIFWLKIRNIIFWHKTNSALFFFLKNGDDETDTRFMRIQRLIEMWRFRIYAGSSLFPRLS